MEIAIVRTTMKEKDKWRTGHRTQADVSSVMPADLLLFRYGLADIQFSFRSAIKKGSAITGYTLHSAGVLRERSIVKEKVSKVWCAVRLKPGGTA